jgi:hypothetical protein
MFVENLVFLNRFVKFRLRSGQQNQPNIKQGTSGKRIEKKSPENIIFRARLFCEILELLFKE